MEKAISDPQAALAFLYGEDARFTIRSKPTQARYTFRVRRNSSHNVMYVSTLFGSDNVRDYAYLGMIKGDRFQLTSKSRFTADSPQTKAFEWAYRWLSERHVLPDVLEFWHEGRCCRCGRTLTTPESIENGIGPECAKR